VTVFYLLRNIIRSTTRSALLNRGPVAYGPQGATICHKAFTGRGGGHEQGLSWMPSAVQSSL